MSDPITPSTPARVRVGLRRTLAVLLTAGLGALAMPACTLDPASRSAEAPGPTHALVIRGGRVMDPETGLDAVRDVAIEDGRIVAISATPLRGRTTLDATGQVVAPGFIDLHSHAQTTPSMRMQAFDGVTTALELELGSLPIGAALDRASREGRPINFGFSVSWAIARMKVLDGVAVDGDPGVYARNVGKPNWNKLVGRAQIAAIVAEVEQGLKDGGIGIGILAGYAPASARREYRDLARLAKRYEVPTFTHLRHTNHEEPGGSYEGLAEVIAAAAGTGAHMHLCHINSSSWRDIGEATEAIAQAQRKGLKITTEAYPYGAGSTVIGSPVYAPENLPLRGLKASDIYFVGGGRWVKDDDDLRRIRAESPGGIAVFHFLNESDPKDVALLGKSLLFPNTAIASDAIPYTVRGRPVEGDTWPLPDGADAHPRVAGTFTRVLARWVRERQALTLMEALRRMTLVPAQILADAVPAIARKGRLQVGMDADVVVFDPATVGDRATYENPRQPSVGMKHVLVNGVPVIRDAQLVRDALPGRPVRGRVR